MLQKFFIDIFFPRRCVGCGLFDVWLCPACEVAIRCKPTYALFEQTSELKEIFFALEYQQPAVAGLIAQYKYGPTPELSTILGELALKSISQYQPPIHTLFDAVVPVPLARIRYRWRGFNQAELIARVVGRRLGIPVADVLARTIETKTQVGLSGDERRQNLQGAFRVYHPELVKDLRVLLVDDVFTTGQTLKECARGLQKAGVKSVSGLVVAGQQASLQSDKIIVH